MTKIRTIKRNGKTWKAPLNSGGQKKIERQVSKREIQDLTGVGIMHPGSLTELGYHINEPKAKKHAALNAAIGKYGRTETLRKLGELYRLDYNRPELRARIEEDIKYVSGGKRND
jgi:hypothetical protein